MIEVWWKLILTPLFLFICLINVECLNGSDEALCYERKSAYEVIETCCVGYQQIRNFCEPICENQCIAGRCVAPNKCECEEPYEGDDCSIPIPNCPSGYWGEECDRTCNCSGSPCTRKTGKCTCSPGRRGDRCESDCEQGRYGEACSEECFCGNGTCDPVHGGCDCDDGYFGRNCTIECPRGTYGKNCSMTCPCARCDSVTGECTNLLYDQNSKRLAELLSHQCNKENTKNFDEPTKTCQCKDGWMGDQCNEPCPEGYYGSNCAKKCECFKAHYESCDKATGECECKSGWNGQDCRSECAPGYYGRNCRNACIYYGLENYVCDRFNGDKCLTVYEGDSCEVCVCEPNGVCNTTTASCDCYPGFYGVRCQDTCNSGRYGKNCSKSCKCPNCRPTDGFCLCQSNFSNDACSDGYCPINFYDNITNDCIDPLANVTTPPIVNSYLFYIIITLVSVFVIIVVSTIYLCVRKRRSDELDKFGPKVHVPLRPLSNDYQRDEPQYEEIQDNYHQLPESYDRLMRNDELPSRFNEVQYYRNYETPSHLSNARMNNVYRPMEGDYAYLDRNSVGPIGPQPTVYHQLYYPIK